MTTTPKTTGALVEPTVTRLTGRTTRTLAVLATVVVTLLSSLLPAPSANAVSSGGYSGRPGTTGTIYRIAAGHISTYIANAGWFHTPYLSQSPTDVYRSSATSGAQIVTLDWDIYTYTGGAWQYNFSTPSQTSVPAGVSGARLPIINAYPRSGQQYSTSGRLSPGGLHRARNSATPP